MIINIKVKVGTKENKIVKINENNWEIKTTKRAISNDANESIIEQISKDMKIAKSKINIVAGVKSKNKKIEIQNPLYF